MISGLYSHFVTVAHSSYCCFFFFPLKASTDDSTTELDDLITSAPVTETSEPATTPALPSTTNEGKEQSDTSCLPYMVQEQKRLLDARGCS